MDNKKYKLIKHYGFFSRGTILELTGDKTQYSNGKDYIDRTIVENEPEYFEPQKADTKKPLTAESFLGGV